MKIFGKKNIEEVVEKKVEDIKEIIEDRVEDVVENIKDEAKEKLDSVVSLGNEKIKEIKEVKEVVTDKVEATIKSIEEEIKVVSEDINSDTEKEPEKEEESESKEIKPEEVEKTLEENLLEDGIKIYEERDDISQTKLEILSEDVTDRHSVIFFGAKAQENINKVSEHMLRGVQSKDLGYAGDNLNNLISTLKGFDIDKLDPTRKQGFLSKMFGFASPVTKFLSSYDTVRVQIDKIVDNLEEKKTNLLTDITSLERLYNANLSFIDDLDTYIAAGAYKVKVLSANLLSLEEEAQGSKKLEKKLGVRDK
ncbi:MAG TPA: hypothetical protein EYG69_05395, partial [Campylobacterales bacterium]|nr:hypothetical protein [Campylobacterales bacterium]